MTKSGGDLKKAVLPILSFRASARCVESLSNRRFFRNVHLPMPPLRVLGIDPGYGRTGLGIVDVAGGDAVHVWHSVIETMPESAFVERLVAVRNDLAEAIRRFSPQVAC